jgi:hypothetical protein
MPTVDSEEISKVVRRAEIKQFKEGGRKKLSQSDRKDVVADYVAKQFKKHQLVVAETSAEFLAHTPTVSLADYILPAVWSEWDKEQGKIVREHISNPEPEPKKVRKIKRTTVKKQDDYNPDEYQPWEDIDDLFERTVYDEENTLDDDEDIFPEDIEEREEQEASDEGWQYPIELSKSTASITEAKRRGLVPQSGNWQKPKRWVRSKDADVPVEEKTELVKLPEDTWKYFNKVPNTILVDIDKLVPTRARPDGILEANKRMQGYASRRKPLDLKDNGDGTYSILDGNSTYANAVHSEWKELPGVVIEEDKPRKKASEDVPISHLTIDAMKAVFSDDFSMSDFQDMYSIGLDGFSTNIVGLRGTPSGRKQRKGMGYSKSEVTIEVEILVDNENYTDNEEYEKQPKGIDGYTPLAGIMSRTFTRNKDGTLSVKHNRFGIENDFQGKGIASNINEHVEKEYEKLGVDNIMLNANAKIGGYAWARQGYDFMKPDFSKGKVNHRPDVRKHFITRIGYLLELGDIDKKTHDEYVSEVESLEHSWEFASWNPSWREKDSENLGKSWMLGQTWDAEKTLDKKSLGYQIGKAYFAAKRNSTIKG